MGLSKIKIVSLMVILCFSSYKSFGQTLNTCVAGTQTELQNCLNQAQGFSTITQINITANIVCNNIPCGYTVNNVLNKLTITGTNISAGLKRTSNFTKPLLSISNSKNIRVESLTLDEGNNLNSDTQAASPKLCPPSLPENCASTAYVSSSQNIVFDNVLINGSKQFGLGIVDAKSITVSNSTIQDSWLYGIWLSKNYPSSDIKIENNKFIKNRSNGILFLGKTSVLEKNIIARNIFSGNHYNSAFFTCGSGTGPCSGGQLLIEAGTDQLLIDSNTIIDGAMINSQHASGIEFATTQISNVKLVNNRVTNNAGYGIVKNESSLPPLPNIILSNNIVVKNLLDNVVFPEAIIQDTSCTFNESSVANGASVTAYLTASVPSGQTCQSQSRTCTNGILSGSYTQATCQISAPVVPLKIISGGVVTTYNPFVIWLNVKGASASTKINLYANGVYWGQGSGVSLSGDSMSFSLPGNLAVGNCNLKRSDCSLKVELENTSLNEKASLNMTLPSVNVSAPALNCTFNGSTITSGNSITAFATATVPYGQTCQSETRLCTNGVLSGTFTQSTCQVSAPVVPLKIISGGVVTTYNPFVIWLSVKGVSSSTAVNLYVNGVLWGHGSGIALNGDSMSFNLPSNKAPGNCNVNRSDCSLRVELENTSTSEKSNGFNLLLPSVAP